MAERTAPGFTYTLRKKDGVGISKGREKIQDEPWAGVVVFYATMCYSVSLL